MDVDVWDYKPVSLENLLSFYNTVMKNQEDLVEILVELSPLATVKGPKELRRKKNK